MKEIDDAKPKINNNKLVWRRVCLDMTSIGEFRKVVEAQDMTTDDRKIVQGYFRTLELIGRNGGGLYGLKSISTIDMDFNLWGLENNIILDANGEIDYRYKLSDIFLSDRQSAVFSHNKWTMHHVNFNTSKSSISHNDDYFDKVTSQIKQRLRPHDKTLVVTHKESASKVMERLKDTPDTDVTYFGDLLGRNDWRDYSQVWVIATNNYKYSAYPLQWAWATGNQLSDEFDYVLAARKNKPGKLPFREDEFEKVRLGMIIADIYQAIKRIDRDVSRNAEVFIVNGDGDVIDRLVKLLTGIKLSSEGIDLSLKSNKSKTLRKTAADRFVEVIGSLPPGEYTKGEIFAQAGIKNFAQIRMNVKIMQLEQDCKIEINHKHIIVYPKSNCIRLLRNVSLLR